MSKPLSFDARIAIYGDAMYGVGDWRRGDDEDVGELVAECLDLRHELNTYHDTLIKALRTARDALRATVSGRDFHDEVFDAEEAVVDALKLAGANP